MRFLAILLSASVAMGGMVRREADPAFYRTSGISRGVSTVVHAAPAVSRTVVQSHGAPRCVVTPVKECQPRTIETPRKVCQTVVDVFEDTVVTRTCEETITTTCTQTSEASHVVESVIDTNTQKIQEGVAADPASIARVGLIRGKREAEPGVLVSGVSGHAYTAAVHPVQKRVGPQDCTSTPVEECVDTPVTKKRNVSRVVCDTVTDTQTVEDCTVTETKTCESSHTYSQTLGGIETF